MSAELIQARVSTTRRAEPPGRPGQARVTAHAGRETVAMVLRSLPAGPPSGHGRADGGPWPGGRMVDEHVRVRATGRDDRWLPIADVAVMRAIAPPFDRPVPPSDATLITCVFDAGGRCALWARGHREAARFTALLPAGGCALAELESAFAWAASFAHGRLVLGHCFTALRTARLTFDLPGRPGGGITLFPAQAAQAPGQP
ncbi:hypothetical protein GCM10023085_11860 [Actinomadura viridis]|uniref:Uncharacterized protein n=1 Tax=Actinomadura viridis TaxID=58110 RepID=A0A931GS46_9ACTN|nr:hypothetical protein [Actinomadura viridis]MBG6093561.1 hypothetical protein [Actinomadura viridis]